VIEAQAIFPSDRGRVYTSAGNRAGVGRLGVRSSMGRTGACRDDTLAEPFPSAVNNEPVRRAVYATKARAKRDVIRGVEGIYKNRRRSNDVHHDFQQQVLAA